MLVAVFLLLLLWLRCFDGGTINKRRSFFATYYIRSEFIPWHLNRFGRYPSDLRHLGECLRERPYYETITSVERLGFKPEMKVVGVDSDVVRILVTLRNGATLSREIACSKLTMESLALEQRGVPLDRLTKMAYDNYLKREKGPLFKIQPPRDSPR